MTSNRCVPHNALLAETTYSSVAPGATIVATKVGDDFQFRGLTAGAGLTLAQNDTTITVDQVAPLPTTGFCLSPNASSTAPVFGVNSVAEFNVGSLYNAATGVITISDTAKYNISWIFNFLTPTLRVQLQNIETLEIVAESTDTIIRAPPSPYTTAMSKTLILAAGSTYRLVFTPGVQILDSSRFSIVSI